MAIQSPSKGMPTGANTAPRMLNALIGVWLFVSAFVWPHSQAQLTNTWIFGVLCVAFAFIAMRYPAARFLNTALSAWLLVSAWSLPSISAATVWNNTIVAIAVFFLSLVPPLPARHRPLRESRA